MNKSIKCLLLASGLLFTATSNAVGLHRVGPNDEPSPPGHGYPLWYQDTKGLALDICIPKSALQQDACLATPLPGDPDPMYPRVFPSNWEDEFFWFGAEALLDLGGGNSAILVEAVEAAFGGAGSPNPGDQISFSRIRIRFNAPVAGNYTVTYPYGVEDFPGIAAGELVRHTVDIGIGAPGDFSGALGGEIGPFLRAVFDSTLTDINGVLTPSYKPYHTIPDSDGSGKFSTFLSDPLGTTLVTGSPFITNYFEVCVDTNPQQCWRQDQFALIGKVHTASIASPLEITSATYSTDLATNTAYIDVHATAVAGPGASPPILTVGIVGLPSAKMVSDEGLIPQFYAQSTTPISSATAVPNEVTVINSSDNPASSAVQPLVDKVTITNATYEPGGFPPLNITAVSSDQNVTGFFVDINGVPVALELIGSIVLDFPPDTLTVTSAAGGSAIAQIVILPSPFGNKSPPGAPLAVDDLLTIVEGTPGTLDVLLNDGKEAVASTLNMVTIPAHGVATIDTTGINNTGILVYTPDTGYFGTDSFKYTVSSSGGLSSNVATVTIEITSNGNNAPPTAGDDTASVSVLQSVIIDVAANDADDTGLDLASIVIEQQGTGTVVVNGDGTVTYTAAGIVGIDTFSYTIADIEIPTSARSAPATVTVVVGAGEILDVQRSQCKAGKNEWRVDGTSSMLTPHSVTVYAGPTVGGTIIASNVSVDNFGAWRLSKNNTSADCVLIISIESSLGGELLNVPITLR